MVAAPASYNFADVWEMAADALGDKEALVIGDQRRTYAQLEDRANRLANHLLALGVGPRQHVGLYLENCPEYLEAMLACFKIRAVPINVNHRYVAAELEYLLDDSQAVGVVHGPQHREVIEAVLPNVPVVQWSLVTGPDYDAALGGRRARPAPSRRPGQRRPLRDVHGRHHRAAQGCGVAPGGRLLRVPRRWRSDADAR